MAELERMGIKRVLNPREFHSDDDEAQGTELQLFRVSMNAGDIQDKEVIEALAIIAVSDEPILVHCWHGSDRTGTIVAMYRMVFQDWPSEKAMNELVNDGYHAIYGGIAEYIRSISIKSAWGLTRTKIPTFHLMSC